MSDAKTVDAESGTGPPRKMNPMQKKRAKYAEKFEDMGIKGAEWQGENVINLGRTETTDTWCCFVLIAFFIGTIGLGLYGVSWSGGVPAIAPYDVDGNMCGITEGFEDYKFLFFNTMSTGS